jgi:hypothetical protein
VTNVVRLNRSSLIPVLACLTLVLGALFVPSQAMGQAVVQSNFGAAATLPFTNPQVAGNMDIVVIGWSAPATASVTSVTDTAKNNYAIAVGTFISGSGAGAVAQEIFYAPNIVAGANTVTVGFSTNVSAPDIRILEVSGVSTTLPLESASGNAGNNGTASSGSIAFGANSIVIVGGMAGGAFSANPAGNFTDQAYDTNTGNTAGDIIEASAGSQAATDTASGVWVLQAAAFGTGPTLPAPTIAGTNGISPSVGPDTGGTGVIITGTNFASGATVSFGSVTGVDCAVTNATTISCLSPTHNSGAVDVTVTNVDGQSAVSTNAGGGGFDFTLQQPSFGAPTPATGSTNGSTMITLTGSNFLAGATVTFNEPQFENLGAHGLPALPAGNVVVSNNGGTLTATTPALPAIPTGAADVTVTNPDGGSTPATAAFTYAANPAGINYVQRADSATGSTAGPNFSAPMLNLETAGHMNVVVIGWSDTNATVVQVTDSEGNTYVPAVATAQGTGVSQAIYYAPNIKGDTINPNNIAVQFSRAASAPDLRVMEYSGLAAATPLDIGVSNVGTSILADTLACSASTAGELVVAGATVSTAISAPDPKFAMVDLTTIGDAVEHEILAAAGSCEATMPLTNSGNWVIQAAAFKTVSADFSLIPGAQNPTQVQAGSSASYSITVTPSNGFTGSVTFTTCAGLPAGDGLSCSVSPSSVTPGDSATLTITTTSSTPVQTYNNITVTGTAGNLTHTATVSLKVAAAPTPSFAVTATALTPASIAAGSPSTSTVTVTPSGGFSSAVALTCAITPVTAVPPTCGFSSASVAGGNGTSTLTVTTVAASTSARPGRGLAAFYAMLLPLCGVTLLGASLTPRRKKLVGLLLVCFMLSGLVFLAACGGGSSSGGGGGGGTPIPATTSGTYTVAVTGTATGATTQTVTPALTVTVQ